MQYHQIAVIGMSGRFAQSETLLDFRMPIAFSWEASRTLTASTTSISAFRPKRRIL